MNYSEYQEQSHNSQAISQQFSDFSSIQNNYEIPNINLNDLNIQEDKDQIIPSSPLVAKNKDSTSYSSVLKYLRENFDIDQSPLENGTIFSENYKRKYDTFQDMTPIYDNKFNDNQHKLKKIKLSASPISTCPTSDNSSNQTPIKFLSTNDKINIKSITNLGVIQYEDDRADNIAMVDREMEDISIYNNSFIRFGLNTFKGYANYSSGLIDF